jgi:uncharacterized Ntn-hydrolase superfamily protein
MIKGFVLAGLLPGCGTLLAMAEAAPPVATFSIVAFDPDTRALGVAVQSKFFAVGSVVPYAKAGVGAIATQSFANTTYGPRGLAQMESGKSARETLLTLTGTDTRASLRQVGIVDGSGQAVAFTGDGCKAWAGHIVGTNYCVQGNILAGEAVVKEMEQAFLAGEGSLADRMLAALVAGQVAGGDRRGRQSAALLVVRKGGGYAGLNDRYIDIRADDHPSPIQELKRLLDKHREFYPR